MGKLQSQSNESQHLEHIRPSETHLMGPSQPPGLSFLRPDGKTGLLPPNRGTPDRPLCTPSFGKSLTETEHSLFFNKSFVCLKPN